MVVFSAHLEPLNQLAERDGWKKITGDVSSKERQNIVDEFQSGKLKGVAASIKAGGVGITLTRAWKAIFVDLDWVPGANQQAEDRICRIGQESNKIEIVRMVSDHSLDLHVLELIAWKMSIIQSAVEDVVQPKKKVRIEPLTRQDVDNIYNNQKEQEDLVASKNKENLRKTIDLISLLLEDE